MAPAAATTTSGWPSTGPGHKRLTDVQLSFSLAPDHFTSSVYVGDYATAPLQVALQHLERAPSAFLERLNPLLQSGRWVFGYAHGSGRSADRHTHTAPLSTLPDDMGRADSLWLRQRLPRADVLSAGPDLVGWAIDSLTALWPVYRFWLVGPG